MAVDLIELSHSIMNLECYKRYMIHLSLKDSGVYFGQPPILDYLNREGTSTQNDIAKAMRVSPASVAVSVRRMQKSGLIAKVNDKTDLRCNKISITKKGIEQLNEIHKKFYDIDKIMYEGFSNEELEQLKAYLDRLNENLYKSIPDKSNVFEIMRKGFVESCEKSEGENE